MHNNYKYYDNYDKNVKAIRGGGVITPANPPNKKKTTDTIKNIWNDDIIPTPPLYKSVYYSDKNLTNGYLNDDNYVDENESISDYYYPSQKFNDVINLKNNGNNENEKKILNDLNPIQFPPPLINYAKYSKKNISKKQNESNEPNEFEKSEKNIKDTCLDYIINNTIYDGKYMYTLENKPINKDIMTKCKINYLPYTYEKNTDDNKYENFDRNDNEQNLNHYSNDFESTNNILLIIFSILIIIYFTIYQK